MDEPTGFAEFFADGGDVDVDCAVGDEDIGAHGFVHELIAGEDAAAGADQSAEEFEFGQREFDGSPSTVTSCLEPSRSTAGRR